MASIKALVLFSGGLDSILAAKTLEVQGILVEGVCFCSNFFGCEKAEKAALVNNIKLHKIDISKEELELVKNPPSGYGKNLNPCIDCHAMMLRTAKERFNNYDIYATGEVLGQRPFSQTKDALSRVSGLSGAEVLRPLSAKLLNETEYEKKGLVVRGRLHSIRGRSREKQMDLVKKYGIKNPPSPAGGCLLTDPEFSARMIKMLDYWPDCNTQDVELLKHGRVFWLNSKEGKVLVVVGRNKENNEALEKLVKKGDVRLELQDVVGPTTVVRHKDQNTTTKEFQNSKFKVNIPSELRMSEFNMGEEKSVNDIVELAGLLTGWYSTKARGSQINIKIF